MAAFKFVNIVALATLAVLAGSYGPQPVNALSAHGPPHLNRADHHAIAQKQRRQDAKKSKRCRKRPSSLTSSAPASTSSAQVTSSDVKTSSSEIKTSSSSTIKATSTAVKTSSEVKSSETPKDSPAPQTTAKATSTKTSSSAQQTSTAASNNNGGSGNNGGSNNGGSNNNNGGSNSGAAANPGAKVGLAWPNGNAPTGWTGEHVGWMYSWSVHPPDQYLNFPGLKFIPMLWGPDQEKDFTSNVHKYLQSGWVASFNEPNQAGQSNIDPTYAAQIHKRVIQPLADQGMKVLAPATSSDPRGLTWMKTFMKACDGCTFNAMGIHYYDITFEGFKNYLNLWHDSFGLPLMVTEFACQDFNGGPQRSKDEVWAFWSESIKYMEAQDWIINYHGFGAMREMQGVNPDNQLMNPGNGQPNSLGYTYINKSW